MTNSENAPAARGGTRAEIFAWAMYDWANSAYSTLSITILMAYIITDVVPHKVWGSVVWPWGISASMLAAALLSPILGALADANCSKRKWLAGTALLGAAMAVVLALVPPSSTWLVIGLFVTTSLLFELSLGFYNGFLPEIATEQTINRVSAWGYALGYLGGALALILAVLVLNYGEKLGLTKTDCLRAGLLIMGLWWAIFTIPTLWILRDHGSRPEQTLPVNRTVAAAVGEVAHTLKNIRRYKILSLFLLGYLFYNDGIQSVITQATPFAKHELQFTTEQLIWLVLMIQFLALPGAVFVGRLADRLGQKPTLVICLAVWVGLLVAAYFVTSQRQFWMLGAVLALVMGGTQSVSRAIMGVMTPPGRTAEFFGFYNFSGKATSFMGTFLYGLIIVTTESPRLGILSLLVFFLIGWALVGRINIKKGRRQALEA